MVGGKLIDTIEAALQDGDADEAVSPFYSRVTRPSHGRRTRRIT
ncbi:hypothetical protein B0I32_12113 [Nonomuraea fuscirosea]|uniref:Uncharacterized protein n=1 Tax=Nonomuraea fuscirosea TaxID=1291556 RepID=A0A2T0MM61_9ACTN|nr:hypothetical protein B0I32_12113 [Nonomuraea fuscirosea]